MSESGFPQFPTGPRDVTKIPGRGERENGQVRLTGIPDNLREIRTPTRLNGQVIQAHSNGSVRIRTARGDIDVRIPEGQPRPNRGQDVEIEIQPNRNRPDSSPERAILRSETQDSQTPTNPRPTDERQAAQTEARPAEPPPVRSAQTPVDLNVRQDSRPSTSTEPPGRETPPLRQRETRPPFPQTGSVVRLQPFPPRALAALLEAAPLNHSINNTVQSVNISQQIPITNEKPLTSEALLNVSKSALSPAQQTPTPLTMPHHPSPADTARTSFTTFVEIAPPAHTKPSFPSLSLLKLHGPGTLAVPSVWGGTAGIFSQNAQSLTAPKAFRAQAFDVRLEGLSLPKPAIHAPGTPPSPDKAPTENLILQNIKAPSMNGIVIATTPDKLPLVSLFFPQLNTTQIFSLQFPGEPLPPGTQIQVTPQTPPPPSSEKTAALSPPLSAQALPALLTPVPWPVMEELYQTLSHVAPQAAQTFSNIIPNPANPAQFGGATLFFIAALRTGDLSGWMGEKVQDILRRDGRSSLLNRITQEGKALGQLVGKETTPQEWRPLPLPLFWEGEIHKVRIHYKQEQKNTDSPDTQQGKQTRFVFDLNLDRMGKVQLDGLFRLPRLDLIVRTEEAFTQAMQANMRRLYADSLRQTQISGELSFQDSSGQWVTIQSEDGALGLEA